MIKSKGIFAVSFIAMMVVGGAYANIASQGYVDQQIDTRAPAGDYATKTELNAKQNASTAVEVAAAGTAVGDATHPVYVNASGVATKIDKVAAAETADTATSATSATKATQDASGNVITTTYATKTELNAKADAEDIPTVNNATLTIQKNGAAVATFTANSATAATANITVPTKTSELSNDSGFITAAALPEEYTLPAATAAALGGVKSGGDITVAADGAVTVNSATTADSATKATQDASGRVIADTYATKAEIPDEITVDATLSADSTNPVQNKVVKAALDKKLENTATGTGSLSTGGATPATAANAVVIGDAASGAAASVVVGKSAKSSEAGLMSVAVGMNASANDREAVAIGSNANVAGQGVAIGTMAKTTVSYGTAVGYRAETGAGTAIAIGQSATSTALGAIQLGSGTNSTEGTFNVGFGANKNYQLLDNDGKIPDERMPDTVLTNTATGEGAFAVGNNSGALGKNSVAVGVDANGEGANSVVLGKGSRVSGENSIGIGYGSGASGNDAVVIGAGAFTRGANNVVVGKDAGAGGNNSVSLGFGASSNAENAIQIGTGNNYDSGTLSVGFGDSGNYKLLDSSGKIPGERLQISVGSATKPTGYADIWIE